LDFGSGVNVIWCENGTGKTTIIEALHILSIGRSFRTSKSGDLLKNGDEYLKLTGLFEKKKKHDTIE
jgi:DNA replication and repair protein RecF